MQHSPRGTAIGVVLVDGELRIRHFTPSIAFAVHLVPDDIGQSIDHINHSLDLGGESLRQLTQQVLDSKGRIERQVCNHEGAPLLMQIAPYAAEAGGVEGAALAFVDLAATGKLEEETSDNGEEERNRYAARLERCNTELQQLAFVVSHDLREPLRTITSFCDLLEQRYAGSLDDQAGKWIDFITDGCRQMQQLIDDLTAYSRVESHAKPPDSVEVDKALDDALAALRTSIDETGAVITRDELPTLVFEPGHLKLLLQSLVSNAVKFRGDSTPRIHVSARCHGDEWVFSVRDNGIGIKPQFHDRVFEICKRLQSRADYSGTGMGLAICRRIVERAGGRIWVESETSEGSTFFFTVQKSPAVWQSSSRPGDSSSSDEV